MNAMHIGLGLLVAGLLWTRKRESSGYAPTEQTGELSAGTSSGRRTEAIPEDVPWDDDGWGEPTAPSTRSQSVPQSQSPAPSGQRSPARAPAPAPAPAPRSSGTTAQLPENQRRILATINAILTETIVAGQSIHPPVSNQTLTPAAFEAFRRICVLVHGSHTDWLCVGLFDGFPLSAAYRAPRPNIEWYRSWEQFQQFVKGERGVVPQMELAEWLQRLFAMPDHRNVRYQLESLRAMWGRVVNDAEYTRCKVDWRT
jgi:hypothetical protein